MTSYYKEADIEFDEKTAPYSAAEELAAELPQSYRLVQDMKNGEFVLLVVVEGE